MQEDNARDLIKANQKELNFDYIFRPRTELGKKYVATYETSVQISHDDFTVINPSLMVNENTTIGEIESWFRKDAKNEVLQIKIIELENI